MKSLRHDERGQVLVVSALSMVALLGFVAMAADIGMAFRARTNLQKIADSAALAGAAELNSGNWSAAAQYSATQNNLTCPQGNCVNTSLGSTYHPGADVVKVVINATTPTYFMKAFNISSLPISATAVAGLTGGGGACLYALGYQGTGKKGDDLIYNGGGGGDALQMPDCGVLVNDGMNLNGNKQFITAKWIGVGSESGGGTTSPPAITGIEKVPDPLSGFWGSVPTCAGVGGTKGNKSYSSGTVPAGCYRNLSVSGTAALSPGLYVIQGALNVSTSSASTGVTFFVDGAIGGSVGSLDANLTAPPLASPAGCSAGGGCTGLLVWDTEVANFNHPVIIDSYPLTGIMYFPNAQIKIHGNGTTTINATFVVDSLTFDGTVMLHSYATGNVGNPFATATLLE